jgi:dTDP-4-dehydrorhamnose 3,5-epimerase
MEITETALPGVRLLTPRRFSDARGFFAETYSRRVLSAAGIDIEFVQDNHSLSRAAGTMRGLHFQSPPHAQDKLVRCGQGALFDVAVDIRAGSPTYGQWTGQELTAENGRQMFIPKGFLHGFMTLLPDTEIVYKCSDFYAPACDGAVRWNDPAIAIRWPLESDPTAISPKDAAAPLLADFISPFVWDGDQP